ncbi:MAG: restriction endonuclease subunit S [Bacteroidales bacterium]
MKLLELFKELSLHPKNAAELKALILQLAVQGKLTAKWREENPDVEPASELLGRIGMERKALIKEGLLRNGNRQSSVTEKEKTFIIPSSWIWCRFGEVISLEMGQSPVGTSYNDKGTGVPLINGPVEFGPKPFDETRLLKFTTKPTKMCSKGDLLVCVRGATTGRTNIAGFDACIGRGVAAIKPFFDKQYLNYFMLKSRYEFLAKGTGTTFPSISRDEILNFVFALPPLKEQHAIVTTVNQLYAEVEQLEQLTQDRIQLKHDFATSALQRLVQADNINGEWAPVHQHFHTFFNEKPNVKKLRETILQLAVQGKLTTHWRKENPGVEPATELLKRITTEKQQLIKSGKIKKEKPLPPIKDDEIPFELPEGWVWCRLGDAVSYGTNDKVEAKHVQNDTWVLELEDVEKTTSKLLQKVRFSERRFKSTKSVFQTGDVIYGKLRPYLDKVLIADEDGVCTTEMIPISSFAGCLPGYLRWYLKSPEFIFYANNSTHGMNLPRLGTEKALLAVYALPPLQEQHAIVSTVNTLMGLCDALEQELGQQESRVEELMRSCVREVVG